MKRFIFSAIALMVAATACTESGIIDMPEYYQNPIVFDTYIGKTLVTKAEDINVTYLQKATNQGGGIQVYAFTSPKDNINRDNVDYSTPYLDGQLLYSNSSWMYYKGDTKDEPYMPFGKDLAFAAYNLKAEGTNSNPIITNVSDDKTSFDYTVQNAVANQIDLLVTPLTFVTENPNGDTFVPLRFYHVLSRIGFKIQSTGGSETDKIFISSIKLKGEFVRSGRVDMTVSIATPAASTGENGSSIQLTDSNRKPSIAPLTEVNNAYVYEYNLFGASDLPFEIDVNSCKSPNAEPIYTGSDINNRYMMIMPGRVGNLPDNQDVVDDDFTELTIPPYIEVKYQIGTTYSSASDMTAKIPLTQKYENDQEGNWIFESGKAYEFILKLTTATIDFSATVIPGDWDDSTSSDLN